MRKNWLHFSNGQSHDSSLGVGPNQQDAKIAPYKDARDDREHDGNNARKIPEYGFEFGFQTFCHRHHDCPTGQHQQVESRTRNAM